MFTRSLLSLTPSLKPFRVGSLMSVREPICTSTSLKLTRVWSLQLNTTSSTLRKFKHSSTQRSLPTQSMCLSTDVRTSTAGFVHLTKAPNWQAQNAKPVMKATHLTPLCDALSLLTMSRLKCLSSRIWTLRKALKWFFKDSFRASLLRRNWWTWFRWDLNCSFRFILFKSPERFP